MALLVAVITITYIFAPHSPPFALRPLLKDPPRNTIRQDDVNHRIPHQVIGQNGKQKLLPPPAQQRLEPLPLHDQDAVDDVVLIEPEKHVLLKSAGDDRLGFHSFPLSLLISNRTRMTRMARISADY